MRLRDIISADDMAKIARHYTFDAGAVECEYIAGDGALNTAGTARSRGLFTSDCVVLLDSTDISNPVNMADPVQRETILHELVHVGQFRRGFWYRLKMRWWNKTRSYRDRPHEAEAYRVAGTLAAEW